MRIIAGSLRGSRLRSPRGDATRPTSERVREALGSALQARGALEGARVLDLFAGSGALGLEALSRGARSLLAVEHDEQALRCLRDNVRALGVSERARVLPLDLLRPAAGVAARLAELGEAPYDLVLCDPPYACAGEATLLLEALCARGLLAPRALVVLEHDRKRPPARPACFADLACYRHGDTLVALWESVAATADS